MNLKSILICFLFTPFHVFGQDVYFSPPDAAPVMLNASYTGMFDGKIRAAALYQTLWQSTTPVPSRTFGLSVDFPVAVGESGSYLAAGIQTLRDMGADDFSNFYGVASFAYHRTLGSKKCELAMGVQAGYTQKMINAAALYYGDAYVNNFTLYHIGIGNSANSYTLNSGISFSHEASNKFSYTIGLAGNNLVQPDNAIERKNNSSVGTDQNFSLSVGAEWRIIRRLTLRPLTYFCLRSGNTNFIAGSELQYNLGSNAHTTFVKNVFAGSWYHSGDAINISAGIQFWNLRLGIGYESHIGATAPAVSSIDGLNFQVRYITPYKAPIYKRAVPSVRF